MPGRSYQNTVLSGTNDYRYGFNTQESVDGITGSGNHYTAPFWEYDPRVVSRWNTDPVTYPWQSPYTINNCNPIFYHDPLGLWGKKSKAEREHRKAIKRYGEDQVGDLFNRNEGTDKKADWGYHVFDKPNNNQTRYDGDITVSTSRPNASIFDNKGVKAYNKKLGIGFFNDNANWYNSPMTRAIMGDGFSIGLSGSASALFGTDQNLELNWVFRGKDASIKPYLVLSTGASAGTGVDAVINASVGRLYYFSNVSDISALDFLGYSAYGEAGFSVFGGAGAGVELAQRVDPSGQIRLGWGQSYFSLKLGGEISPLTGANLKMGGRVSYLMWHPKLGIHKMGK